MASSKGVEEVVTTKTDECGENEMVPLAVATEVSEGEENHNILSNDDDESGRDDVIRVRLLAPSDLPPGYRLPIRYKTADASFVNTFVRIPEGGVYTGQKFEAEVIPPRRVRGRWVSDIFDCVMRDQGFFLLSILAPAVAWGYIYQAATKNKAGTWCLSLVVVLTVANLLGCIVFQTQVVGIVLIAIMTYMRGRIRDQYKIPGSCIEDGFSVCFCTCCTAVQAHKQLEYAQEHPRCCVKAHPATMIV